MKFCEVTREDYSPALPASCATLQLSLRFGKEALEETDVLIYPLEIAFNISKKGLRRDRPKGVQNV